MVLEIRNISSRSRHRSTKVLRLYFHSLIIKIINIYQRLAVSLWAPDIIVSIERLLNSRKMCTSIFNLYFLWWKYFQTITSFHKSIIMILIAIDRNIRKVLMIKAAFIWICRTHINLIINNYSTLSLLNQFTQLLLVLLPVLILRAMLILSSFFKWRDFYCQRYRL